MSEETIEALKARIKTLEERDRELVELLADASPYVLEEMAYPDEWYDRARKYLEA